MWLVDPLLFPVFPGMLQKQPRALFTGAIHGRKSDNNAACT